MPVSTCPLPQALLLSHHATLRELTDGLQRLLDLHEDSPIHEIEVRTFSKVFAEVIASEREAADELLKNVQGGDVHLIRGVEAFLEKLATLDRDLDGYVQGFGPDKTRKSEVVIREREKRASARKSDLCTKERRRSSMIPLPTRLLTPKK